METKNELKPTTPQKELIDTIEGKIRPLVESGRLVLPKNYSVDNALRLAWLILQETKDASKNAVLDVCTRPSIANSLQRMVTLGLNPAKKQCYFIAYGKTLTCQESYFGDIAILKRVYEIDDITAAVIRNGDEVEIEMVSGRPVVTKHKTSWDNLNSEITGAYCVIKFSDGRVVSDLMTIDRIKKSWDKSKTKQVQNDYPDEMAKRTVIRHCIKLELNSSDDNNLMIETYLNPDNTDRAEMQNLTDAANAQKEAPVYDLKAEEVTEAEQEIPEVFK